MAKIKQTKDVQEISAKIIKLRFPDASINKSKTSIKATTSIVQRFGDTSISFDYFELDKD